MSAVVSSWREVHCRNRQDHERTEKEEVEGEIKVHILSQAIQVHTAYERMFALVSHSRLKIQSPTPFS